jgi:hypothetical protein
MAMKAARLAAALLAVLSLGSCQVLEFIFGSVFPSTTVLIKAQADLSGRIPDSSNSSVPIKVRVVESGVYGYVVVTASLASTGNTAFFYDLNLNPKTTFTGLAGTGVMVDSNGFIALGSQLLNPADLSAAGSITNGAFLSSAGSSGVDGFVATFAGMTTQVVNFSTGAGALTYWTYVVAWPPPGTSTTTPVLSSSISNLQLYAVLDDGNPSGNVILVAGPSNNGGNDTTTSSFMTISKPGFALPPGILDSSPHRDNLEIESFGFAQGSILAYDKSSSSFVRIDPASGAIQSSFYSGTDPSQARYAYRISGGSFYGFDTKTRVLTKYAAWW